LHISNKKIAVIGSGSWATALVKILQNTQNNIGWWMRSLETANHIKNFGHNPRYLNTVQFNLDKLSIFTNINEVIKQYDYLIFAIPSAFLHEQLKTVSFYDLQDKIIISAIKGIVPEFNLIIGEYFNTQFNLPYNQIGVITGPCHAEEVALEKLSYLTIAAENNEITNYMANALSCNYVKAITSDDIFGTEYAAVLKNVIAVAGGICNGLGYGDNFQAVLISNAIREIKRFLNKVHPINRDINDSAYLGDLLVTAYSQFSRNRTFGIMIGKGYSVKAAQLEMNMIAEGYYAVNCIYQINKNLQVHMPITQAVYDIIYLNKSAKHTISKLCDCLD
jgi:glycerol-3-phosphate dehydrogenase (NAD(P)+)